MLLDLFRYWKVKLKIKFSPQIPIPLDGMVNINRIAFFNA